MIRDGVMDGAILRTGGDTQVVQLDSGGTLNLRGDRRLDQAAVGQRIVLEYLDGEWTAEGSPLARTLRGDSDSLRYLDPPNLEDDIEENPFDVDMFKNMTLRKNSDGTFRWYSKWRTWASNDELAEELGKQKRKLQALKDRLEDVVQYKGYAEENILELEEEIIRRHG